MAFCTCYYCPTPVGGSRRGPNSARAVDSDGVTDSDPLAVVVDDLDPLLRPRQVLAIGEWHGTEEFPALITRLVDAAVARDLTVTVGLEVPCSEIPGEVGPFWTRRPEFQDGRSSRAMARLVDELVTRSNGDDGIEIVFLDGPWVAPGSPVPMEWLHLVEQRRDEVMANLLLNAIAVRPRALTLVLAGNQHTRVDGGSGDGSGRPALGYYLRRWNPELVALLARASGGHAWMITGAAGESGGPKPIPDDADLPAGASWADRPGPDGHHGYVHLGRLTASPPAG